MNHIDPEVTGGYVLIVDIVDFSLMQKYDASAQQYLAKRLWDFLSKHSVYTSKEYEALINCTGDGALIAFPNKRRTLPLHLLFDLAEALVHHMQSGDPAAAVRVGINRGAFNRISLPCFEKNWLHAIGTAPNECSRLCGFGDPGDIVVSNDLFNAVRTAHLDWVERFEPTGHPWVIFAKHGVPHDIRLYIGNRHERRGHRPRRLGVLHLVDDSLRERVKDLRSDFNDRVKRELGKAGRGIELGTRVTIFATMRADNRQSLHASEFRYDGNEQSSGRVGRTSYSVAGTGEGTLGIAFALRRPHAIVGLPDYKKNPHRYIERLEKECNMPRAKSENLGHKARAYLAFPFGLDRMSPDGVVCIDTKYPLSPLSEETVCTIGGQLSERHGATLAALWKLRAS